MPRASSFAPYNDPEEYILEWTDRIWIDGALGLLHDHYAPDMRVHGAYGTTTGGVEQVIEASLMKKSSFPTRVGTGEDVVWEARGDDGFVSSHRVLHSGLHQGVWQYGPATQRESVSRNIATCLVRDGLVVEEWVVRDEYAVVEQLGFDPLAVARSLAASGSTTLLGSRGDDGLLGPAPADPLVAGDSGHRPTDEGPEAQRVVELLHEVWNRRMFHRVEEFFHRDVICHSTRRRVVTRAEGYRRELERLLAPFPDAQLEIRDIAVNRSDFAGVRVAVVWLLRGTYSGVPAYGPVTNSPVEILGSSQFLFRGEQLYREWRVYDEIAVLAQIVAARGDADTDVGTATAGDL